MDDKEKLKKRAGVHAAGYVENGMKVGLGTGSTVKYTILELARRIRDENLKISCVPTSISTERLSIEHNIPLYELAKLEGLDIVIDGADEFDENLTLIKGGGGALVREKTEGGKKCSYCLLAYHYRVLSSPKTSPLVIYFQHALL